MLARVVTTLFWIAVAVATIYAGCKVVDNLATSMHRAVPELGTRPNGSAIRDWVDKETGCHYVTIGDSIAARLDKFGQPMCPGTSNPPQAKPTAL